MPRETVKGELLAGAPAPDKGVAMLDSWCLSVLAGEPVPPLLEDAQAKLDRRLDQLDDHEAHDMRIVNAKLKRKAAPFLVVFAVMLVWEAHEVLYGGVGQTHVIAILTSGLVAGGAAMLSPTLVLRDRIKEYYKLEREGVREELQGGNQDECSAREEA